MQLQDLDKLQKEAEMYQKENERLQTEVQLMKQELDAAEKAAISRAKKQAQIGELMQRIKELEEMQSSLEDEASELREQNELLEFRILELEDDSDKVGKRHPHHWARFTRRPVCESTRTSDSLGLVVYEWIEPFGGTRLEFAQSQASDVGQLCVLESLLVLFGI